MAIVLQLDTGDTRQRVKSGVESLCRKRRREDLCVFKGTAERLEFRLNKRQNRTDPFFFYDPVRREHRSEARTTSGPKCAAPAFHMIPVRLEVRSRLEEKESHPCRERRSW